jgi:hypothetical protein
VNKNDEQALWGVRVAGSGMSWRVLVRATDADTARCAVESRGHTVVEVAPGQLDLPPSSQRAIRPGTCAVCRYNLVRLPAGTAGEVTCPECCTVNVAFLDLKTRREAMDRRYRQLRRFAWVIVVISLLVVLVLSRVL